MGSLNANLISSSDSRAIIGGIATLAGAHCLTIPSWKSVSSGSIAVSMEGLYAESDVKIWKEVWRLWHFFGKQGK